MRLFNKFCTLASYGSNNCIVDNINTVLNKPISGNKLSNSIVASLLSSYKYRSKYNLHNNNNQYYSTTKYKYNSSNPLHSNNHHTMKYVVVTGGVVSGIGKGICSSSIGVLLKETGLHVTQIKIDPYLNIDAGTMSPYEHGEVYVLEDGGEVDLDLGNYERFLETRLTRLHNITTGKVYSKVLINERRGDYLGKTVQVVPHVTNAIIDWIHDAAHVAIDSTMPAYADDASIHNIHDNKKKGKKPDVCIIEVGGTVGDIESMVFLEAIRQMKYRVGEDNMCHVHVSLVPVVGAVGEPKSKPTQHSVKELRAAGLSPDIILCRSTTEIDREVVGKISLFCMVPPTHVISVYDVSNIYKVPGMLHKQGVTGHVLNKIKINRMTPVELRYDRLAMLTDDAKDQVNIGIVGKYTGLGDSYLSILKALSHAGMENFCRVNIIYIESEHLEEQYKSRRTYTTQSQDSHIQQYEQAWSDLKRCNGILVPGGFGDRGVQGKISAIHYARTNNVPFFGICYGFQMAVIEYARSVLGIKDANTEEINGEHNNNVVIFMPESSLHVLGGTMRLGGRHSDIAENTLAYKIYDGRTRIYERHRHRYEVDPQKIELLQSTQYDNGINSGTTLLFSGKDSETGSRMECLELINHKFFFGSQYHPEFTSRPTHPNPIFTYFVKASLGRFDRQNNNDIQQQQHISYMDRKYRNNKKNLGQHNDNNKRNAAHSPLPELQNAIEPLYSPISSNNYNHDDSSSSGDVTPNPALHSDNDISNINVKMSQFQPANTKENAMKNNLKNEPFNVRSN